MSSAISASNFIEAMKGWSSEELEQVRSALQALVPKKEKVAKAPSKDCAREQQLIPSQI